MGVALIIALIVVTLIMLARRGRSQRQVGIAKVKRAIRQSPALQHDSAAKMMILANDVIPFIQNTVDTLTSNGGCFRCWGNTSIRSTTTTGA